MIAVWMMYTLVVGILIAAAAWVTERILRRSVTPTRWIWSVAILASFAWPIAARITKDAGNHQALPAIDSARQPILLDPALIRVVEPLANRAASLDPLLLWLWLAVSTAGVGLLIWTDRRTRQLVRRLPTRTMHGVSVRVSKDLGPAVVGWPAGAIVVPRWAEEMTDAERQVIIAHEFHHQRAHDALLLGASAAAVALTPWNLALWWMAHRLRAAIEVDCDARVLRDGIAPTAYAALLCAVAGRPKHPLRAALAISHPTSLLARRIDHMLKPIVRAHPAKLAVAGLLVGGIIIAACEVPTPPDDAQPASFKFEAAETQGPHTTDKVISERTKQELASAEAELEETLRAMERLAARGANDESSELHGEFEALETRVREIRTRMASIAPVVFRMTGDSATPRRTLDKTLDLKELRRPEEVERESSARQDRAKAEATFGAVMRLREVGEARVTGGAEELNLSFGDAEGAPLTYVDGVLVTRLDDISPQDIERIEVLKGPAASRIVGADAAGGIIRITTKTGSN